MGIKVSDPIKGFKTYSDILAIEVVFFGLFSRRPAVLLSNKRINQNLKKCRRDQAISKRLRSLYEKTDSSFCHGCHVRTKSMCFRNLILNSLSLIVLHCPVLLTP